jgi:methyl-accepting chemotaxis protein
MGEISAASSEQASGITEVVDAVSQMDQATQQNAALVEQMAAAATGLSGQAHDLVQVVAAFKLNAGEQNPVPRTPARTRSPGPIQAPRPALRVAMSAPVKATRPAPHTATPKAPVLAKPKAAPAASDDDWETF